MSMYTCYRDYASVRVRTSKYEYVHVIHITRTRQLASGEYTCVMHLDDGAALERAAVACHLLAARVHKDVGHADGVPVVSK